MDCGRVKPDKFSRASYHRTMQLSEHTGFRSNYSFIEYILRNAKITYLVVSPKKTPIDRIMTANISVSNPHKEFTTPRGTGILSNSSSFDSALVLCHVAGN